MSTHSARRLGSRLNLITECLRLSRPLKVADILDIVAVADGDATRVETLLRELFAWHHQRGIAAIQIAFAPAAVAALALVSHGASLALSIVAAVFLVAGLAIGLWRLSALHSFDCQFVFALIFAKAVTWLNTELWSAAKQKAITGNHASQIQATVAILYDKAGYLTLAECVAEDSARRMIAKVLQNIGAPSLA